MITGEDSRDPAVMDEVVGDGLITREKVEVIAYRARLTPAGPAQRR